MVFDEHKGEYVLASGRRAYANNGIIGLDHEGGTFEGYDGGFEPYGEADFTDEERTEIADAMIARWTAWRDKRTDTGTTVVNTHAEQPRGRAVPNMGQLVANAWDRVMQDKSRDKP